MEEKALQKIVKSSLVEVNGTEQDSYFAMNSVSMGNPNSYSGLGKVVTFRGGPQRQNAADGTVNVVTGQLKLIRNPRTSTLGGASGYGYNAQPIIVKWYKNIRELMNINDTFKNRTALREVIAPSNDGKIYFFDLDTANYTRDPIEVGVPMSVTASVNPYGYPLLYVGQSSETVDKYKVNAGLRVFNLIDQSRIAMITSINTSALGKTHGVHSSPLVETDSDTVLYSDANGMIYTVGMNTNFDVDKGTIFVAPSEVGYVYTPALKNAIQGIESSISAYGDYIYFGDQTGSLQCLDMNTLQCVWAKDMTDSVMASIAIEDEGSGVYLYVGTVVNKTKKSRNLSLFKLDALTGDVIWEYKTEFQAKFETKSANAGNYAGLMASPLIGQGDISDLVIFNVNRLAVDKKTNTAVLYALDKTTGEVTWMEYMDAESMSSPIAMYDASGKSFIVVGDESGLLRLMDGYNGTMISSVDLGSPIEASPAAYGNHIVVGTTGGMLCFVDVE